MKDYSEAAVRQLRANIYGECSDQNWAACKGPTEKSLGWMHPENIRWLLAHQPKLGS